MTRHPAREPNRPRPHGKWDEIRDRAGLDG